MAAAVLVVGHPRPTARRRDRRPRRQAIPPRRARALHALNRLTYGPRPGDVDRVVALGVDRWIEQQLRPKTIADKRLETRLSGFEIVRLSNDDLADVFYRQQRERGSAN